MRAPAETLVAVPNPVTAVRQAVVDRLNGNPELQAIGLEAFRVVPNGGAAFPVAFLEISSSSAERTQRNRLVLEFTLVVITNGVDSEAGQTQLDALLAGAGSVRRCLEGDRTLGGTCLDVKVGVSEARGQLEVAGAAGWGHSWIIECTINEGERHG